MSELLAAYIASLPEGLSSHPTFEQKGSIARTLLQAWPEIRAVKGLPAPIAALIESPPLPSAWIPEAHGMSLWLLAADLRCGGDPQAFADFSFRVNETLFKEPMYQVAFRVLGARLTVRAIGAAWSTFHRGIEQRVTLGDALCEVELQHPPRLIAPPLIPSYGAALAAGLAVAGVKATIEPGASTDTVTRYRARWGR